MKLAAPRGVIHALGRLDVVRGFRKENIPHERLGVAIVERKPTRLHLHHDPVSRQEHVIHGRQDEFVRQRCSWQD
jgi:hypothetical protein